MINPLGGVVYLDGVKALVTDIRAEYAYRLIYPGVTYVLTLYFTEKPPRRINREQAYREITIPQGESEEWGIYRVIDQINEIDDDNRRYIELAVQPVMNQWQGRDTETIVSDRSHGDIAHEASGCA